MVDRSEPLFYVRVQPVGAGLNEWHRLDLTGLVESFTYEDDETKADQLSLTVNNHNLKHFSDPVFRQGNKLVISWGYPGLMSPPRTVVIRKVVGHQRLKVDADGLEVVGQREPRFRVFENMKRSDAVRQVARELGYKDEFALHIQDTGVVHEQIVQANQTDHEFISRLARKEGFLFFLDWDGFHFHERNLAQSTIRELRYYNIQRFEPGDVLSVNVEADVTAKPGRVRAKGRSPKSKRELEAEEDADSYEGEITAEVEIVEDPETGEEVEVGYTVHRVRPSPFAPTKTVERASGVGGAPNVEPDPSIEPGQPAPFLPGGAEVPATLPAAAAPTKEVIASSATEEPLIFRTQEPLSPTATADVVMSSEEDPEAVQREATKRYRGSKQAAMKIKVRLVGDPTFVAKSVFFLSNVGKKLSQRYYARNVKHTLSNGGFTTDVVATADGAGGIQRESDLAPGLTSIGVRAKKRRKPKKQEKEPGLPRPEGRQPIAVVNKDGQITLVRRRGEAKRDSSHPIFVATPGHTYSDPEAYYRSRPPFLTQAELTAARPPAGAGGAGGGGPPPPEAGTPSPGGAGEAGQGGAGGAG